METYKFLREVETAKVEKTLVRSQFTIDKALTPDLYRDVIADKYKLPSGVIITLVDGLESKTVLSDRESVFSKAIVLSVVSEEGDPEPIPEEGFTVLTQAMVQNPDSTGAGLITGQRAKQAFDSYWNGGMASFTGDDMTESLVIPHGLGQVPKAHVCNRNADGNDTPALFTSMADAENIWVMFGMAPAAGVTININWIAFK